MQDERCQGPPGECQYTYNSLSFSRLKDCFWIQLLTTSKHVTLKTKFTQYKVIWPANVIALVDIISTQSCWHWMFQSKDGSNQPVRWTQNFLFALKEVHSEGEEKRRGWAYFLAIRRLFNGVFQFAVAGNERKLKPGQIFIPEKRTRLEEKAERRGGVWRWVVVRLNR